MAPKSELSKRHSPSSSSSSLGAGIVFAILPALVALGYWNWDSFIMTAGSQFPSVSVPVPVPAIVDSSSDNNITNNKDWIERMQERYAASCPTHSYRTRIFSADPLILYLENFITDEERGYLMYYAESRYYSSLLTEHHDHDTAAINANTRSSQSAIIDNDPVAQCIQQRSALFQGNLPLERVEHLQVVQYQTGQQYNFHYDWYEAQAANPRMTTIFAYLACDAGTMNQGSCEGGATQFPTWIRNFHAEWCDVVDCHNGHEGVGFKPIEGNAVFWSNVYANGSAFHPDTLHAGMPVKSGRKIGLNIWTRRDTYCPDTDL